MKKKWKKPGFQPLLPHEVRTVAATRLDKTDCYSCPFSAVFALTKSNTSRSSSAVVYAMTKFNTCKNSHCVYA